MVHACTRTLPCCAPQPPAVPRSNQMLEDDLTFNEQLIEEKEQDIANIARNVQEVHEIFRDLGTMVREQGAKVGACAPRARAHLRLSVAPTLPPRPRACAQILSRRPWHPPPTAPALVSRM